MPVKWVVFLLGLVAFPVFLGGLAWPCPLPPVEWACGLFGPAPPVRGSVFSRGTLVTILEKLMLSFSPCRWCPCPCSDAVLRSVKKHWLGSPSLWFAWVCSGPLGGAGAGRWRQGVLLSRNVCVHVCMDVGMYDVCRHVCMYVCMYICMYVCMGVDRSSTAFSGLYLQVCKKTLHIYRANMLC